MVRSNDESTKSGTPRGDAGSDRRRWLALAVIVAAQFMVVLDVAIVNVALPSIKTDLQLLARRACSG